MNCLAKISTTASTLAMLVSSLAPASRAAAAPPAPALPAGGLHLIATIDGSDDLHVSQRGAKWVHKTWGPPADVRINGRPWNPQQQPLLADGSRGLLASDLDLGGAVLHVLRGRGSVELGRDADGLVVHFDDPENGADTYEVEILFAQRLARKAAAAEPFELRLDANIDDTDEVWFTRDQAKWLHTTGTPPTVSADDHPWDVARDAALHLRPPLLPDVMDLQRATLTRLHGRGTVNLEYRPGQLCLDFEDRAAGPDQYGVVVRVPPFGVRHLVTLKTNVPGALLGAPLKIYRVPAPPLDDGPLPGQRVFDARGQCQVALEPGQYRFEVLHQPDDHTLVALRTGTLTVAGPTTADLPVRRTRPRLYGPGHHPFKLDELFVRSTDPTGGLRWTATGANPAPPLLLLSPDQAYNAHAFGHADADRAAVWTTLRPAGFADITLKPDEWRSCAFRWAPGTPRSTDNGVVLQFPDGQLNLPRPAEKARLFTNRRFFSVAYWLAFDGGRKAVFEPRGFLLPATVDGDVLLGGPLRPVASAAVLQDESLGRPDARHLWWEITLADPQNYLLDPAASKIDWQPALTTADGKPAKTAPLSDTDVQALGNLKDSLTATASYRTDAPHQVSLHPDPFVELHTARVKTQVPPYRDWNTRAYLAKMARELDMIALARQQPLSPDLKFNISWWFNNGAVGGNNSVTMSLPTYLGCRDWYTHPWAIAHEMLHSFGYGHTHEMDRLDRDVQRRMSRFQWDVADHPAYVPEGWDDPPRP